MGIHLPDRGADDVSAATRTRPCSGVARNQRSAAKITDVADRAVAAMQRAPDVATMAEAAAEVALDIVTGVATVDVAVIRRDRVVPIVVAGAPMPAVYAAMADCTQGPPILAVDESSPVVSSAVGFDDRWPCFGPRAARRGVNGAVSVAVDLGHEHCAMSFWFPRGADVDDTAELHALLIASLLGAAAPFATEALDLHRALRNRDVIGQAKGILMERHHLDEDGAYDMLVDASSRTGRKLVSIAERLTQTGEVAGWTPADRRA